ncbi:MAG: cell division protein ZapA [Bacteroidales bacterium]|nr:cell division protein ZapA [Bacteroidales bacterium]
MEEENVKVTVKIGQRPLTIIIKKEWEHYFLEAEKVINDSFFEFAKKWQYKDQQDLTNMVLLDFVVKALADKERLREYDEELVPMMESLKQLTEQFPID